MAGPFGSANFWVRLVDLAVVAVVGVLLVDITRGHKLAKGRESPQTTSLDLVKRSILEAVIGAPDRVEILKDSEDTKEVAIALDPHGLVPRGRLTRGPDHFPAETRPRDVLALQIEALKGVVVG